MKGDQICTWWMMFESSSTDVEKGTCENVSTLTLKSVFARGGRKCKIEVECVYLESECMHACIYSGI
jgi:hypothetical protein